MEKDISSQAFLFEYAADISSTLTPKKHCYNAYNFLGIYPEVKKK
jgi:hypothetical protein